MAGVDVIVTPASLYVAPPLEGWGTVTRMFARPSFYGLSTVVGAPAMSVPCGFSRDGLPIGLQIMARPFDEAEVLKVGDAYQRLSDWHLRRPPAEAWG
jgi:aspartyl-tRNA(Asn)/glutamyl-tRNA(Gln) amidotransferase subunit A